MSDLLYWLSIIVQAFVFVFMLAVILFLIVFLWAFVTPLQG